MSWHKSGVSSFSRQHKDILNAYVVVISVCHKKGAASCKIWLLNHYILIYTPKVRSLFIMVKLIYKIAKTT